MVIKEGIVIKQRNKLLTNKMPKDWHDKLNTKMEGANMAVIHQATFVRSLPR